MEKIPLDFCIFFVTSKCDSHCPACFYRDKLNQDDELSTEEIEQIATQVGHFSVLLLSGGEPFLRNDLAQIVSAFIKHCKPKHVSIPTNGLNTLSITDTLDTLLKDPASRYTKFSINPSLDALENLNSKLRGRQDAFTKCVDTLYALSRLKEKYDNLSISVNTVFSSQDPAEIKALFSFVSRMDFVDFHSLEIVRPKSLDGYSEMTYHIGMIKELHSFAAACNEKRFMRKLALTRNPLQWLIRLYRSVGSIGYLRYVQKIQTAFLEGKKRIFACPAGLQMWVIEPEGSLRPCELRPVVGSLRQDGYLIVRTVDSVPAREIRRIIRKDRCICTHACFISEYLNLELKNINVQTYFFVLFYYLIFVLFEKRSRRMLDI
jgi:MoaA/NifB/PqqE/SkfB family radical SAM enzyme